MNNIINLLLHYKYLILLPLSVIEGPIITVIAGFFATMGIFNPYLVYTIAVVGDIFGDTLAYGIGRWGSVPFINHFGRYVGITPEKTEKARAYFETHHTRAVLFSKIFHGVGVAGLITAGNLKVPYKRFFWLCIRISLVQSAIFLTLGLLFGKAYIKFGRYLDYFGIATIGIGIAVLLFFIIKKYIKRKK